MLYRNKKTGAIVSVESEVTGNWEKVEPSPAPVLPEKKTAGKKAPAKKRKAGK